MTADELRKILESMPYKGGGAEGAMWAVGKILDSLQTPKPRFIEGYFLDFRVDGECWKISFSPEAVASVQELKRVGAKPTAFITLHDGARIDAGCDYKTFMEKLNATDPV